MDSRLIPADQRGIMALPGAVLHLIHRKGCATVPVWAIRGERLFDQAMEAGGQELTREDEHHFIPTAPDQFHAVAEPEEVHAPLSA